MALEPVWGEALEFERRLEFGQQKGEQPSQDFFRASHSSSHSQASIGQPLSGAGAER
jgi:hypothetical protein